MLVDQPGTYVLILHLSRRALISIGKLGVVEFPAGWYAYAGSARGPGGLAARIGRHRRESKTQHWHVDYLRSRADLVSVWYAVGSDRRECRWAEALSQLDGAWVPASGFGASDCRCTTHLLGFPAQPPVASFSHRVGGSVSQLSFSV